MQNATETTRHPLPPASQGYVLGVDIGGTNLRLALASRKGRIVSRLCTTTVGTRNPEDVLRQIVDGADIMLQEHGLGRHHLRCIGAGAPGITDVDNGVVVATSYLFGWKDVPLARLLQEALHVPAAIDNDVNLATLAEGWAGTAKDETDFVFLAVGTGIGAGIMLRGALLRGRNWLAGEIGYMLVPGTSEAPDAPGIPGALERVSGGEGIRTVWREQCADRGLKHSPEMTTAEIFELARSGDEFSQSIVEQCATPLAYAIHNVALVLNVPLVVMGGSVGTNPMYLSAVRAALQRRSHRSTPVISASGLDRDAQLIGAVRLATGKLADRPR